MVTHANSRNTKITLLPISATVVSIPILVMVQPTPQNGLDRPSVIRVPDVTTFDKSRLKKKLGAIAIELLRDVEQKLRTHLGL
ncbi:MAG: type II toxin-antitoxin system PemK/MazF family toxin [Candidatus Xenobia bacterium]